METGADRLSGSRRVSAVDAEDQHGCWLQQQDLRRVDRTLQDRPDPRRDPRPGAPQVFVLRWSTSTGHLELPAGAPLPPGPVPTLTDGSGPVLGLRGRRQASLGGTVPAGSGLRAEQREDKLVSGREAQRVR